MKRGSRVPRRSILVMGCLILQGCAAQPHLLIPDGPAMSAASLDAILAAHPLPDGQNIRAVVLGRTEALSYHLVQIRDREQPHVHATHDLVVMLLRGTGTFYIRGTPYEMHAGNVAIVPHGTAHFFVNTESAPAVSFVTFAPPYDGTDQVPVQGP